jgi:hypothetical protein
LRRKRMSSAAAIRWKPLRIFLGLTSPNRTFKTKLNHKMSGPPRKKEIPIKTPVIQRNSLHRADYI